MESKLWKLFRRKRSFQLKKEILSSKQIFTISLLLTAKQTSNKKRKSDQRNLDQSLLVILSKYFLFCKHCDFCCLFYLIPFNETLTLSKSLLYISSLLAGVDWKPIIKVRLIFLVIWQRKIHSFMALNGWLF